VCEVAPSRGGRGRQQFQNVARNPAPLAADRAGERCIGVGYSVLPERFDMCPSTPRAVRPPMIDFVREPPLAVAQMEELLARVPAGRAREGHEEGTEPWTTKH
jgi:hypothetical protein